MANIFTVLIGFCISLSVLAQNPDSGIQSYRNFGVIANEGLRHGSHTGGRNWGYEDEPGVTDPYNDPRLKSQSLKFIRIPKKYVASLRSSNFDPKELFFEKDGYFYLPMLQSSVGSNTQLANTLANLNVDVTIVADEKQIAALRLESRSHVFKNRQGKFLKYSAKSNGDYYSMVGPGNPDDTKFFPPGLATLGIIISDFFEAQMNQLPENVKTASPLILLPDRAAFWIDTKKVPGFDQIPFQEIFFKTRVQETSWSVRDLSKIKDDHIYVAEFSAPHTVFGAAIALANGYANPFDFWLPTVVETTARSLVWSLFFSGAETFSLHSQNKTYEFDQWMRPTGKLFIKDASDFILRESTFKNLGLEYPEVFKQHRAQHPGLHQDMDVKLVEASFYNAGLSTSADPSVRDRYVFISTAFENRGSFDNLYDPNKELLSSSFESAVVDELAALTGISKQKIRSVVKMKYNQGYCNLYFDTWNPEWKNIADAMKSPRKLARQKSRFTPPTKNVVDLIELLSKPNPLNEPTKDRLARLIDNDPAAVIQALALKIARMEDINESVLGFVFVRLPDLKNQAELKSLMKLIELQFPKFDFRSYATMMCKELF